MSSLYHGTWIWQWKVQCVFCRKPNEIMSFFKEEDCKWCAAKDPFASDGAEWWAIWDRSCLLLRWSAISFSFGGEGILQQHGHIVTRLFLAGAEIMIKYTTEEMSQDCCSCCSCTCWHCLIMCGMNLNTDRTLVMFFMGAILTIFHPSNICTNIMCFVSYPQPCSFKSYIFIKTWTYFGACFW